MRDYRARKAGKLPRPAATNISQMPVPPHETDEQWVTRVQKDLRAQLENEIPYLKGNALVTAMQFIEAKKKALVAPDVTIIPIGFGTDGERKTTEEDAALEKLG